MQIVKNETVETKTKMKMNNGLEYQRTNPKIFLSAPHNFFSYPHHIKNYQYDYMVTTSIQLETIP